tara:strand:- start:92 stop:649 length:558 start_codon:yes stop_codon:yes gene_type:complete
MNKSSMNIKGTLKCEITIPSNDFEKVKIEGLKNKHTQFDGDNVTISGERSNSFVNTGLENALDLLFGLGGSIVSHIGVTDDTTVVTATTTKLDPTDDDNVTLLSAQSLARVGRVVTGEATFTHVNANFAYKKIGFLSTATDAGTGLIDVIGGGGTSPYNQAFNIDLTGATTWSATLGIEVEFKAS